MKRIETWGLGRITLVTCELVLAKTLNMSEERSDKLFKEKFVSEGEYRTILHRTEIGGI